MEAFLKPFWMWLWFILGYTAMAVGFAGYASKAEPAIIAICLAMIMLTEPKGRLKLVAGFLGVMGALLVIIQ